jgi:beta-xylosidase
VSVKVSQSTPGLPCARLPVATSLGLGFTGAFAAVVAYDVGGTRRGADFDYFEYSEQ